MPFALSATLRIARAAAFLVVLSLSAAPAKAQVFTGVPDPRFSIVPPCLGICPAGDQSFTVTVRDVNNAGVSGAQVSLYVGNFPNAVVISCVDCAQPSGYNVVAKRFVRTADVNGVATFTLCGSMFCPSCPRNWLEVDASGVVLANVAVHTTDLDADGDVDAQDVALVTAAAGTTYPQGDEDCNLTVNAADAAFVTAHLGHRCTSGVPVLPSTWGSLKAGYR